MDPMQDQQSPQSITILLRDLSAGRGDVELLYARIKQQFQLMSSRLLQGRPDAQAPPVTEIVDDVFLELLNLDFHWENRRVYFSVAAKAMRHRIANHYRALNRKKRGGGRMPQPLTGDILVDAKSSIPEQIVEVSDLLDSLHDQHPLAIEALDHRAFGGWSLIEIAEMMDKEVHQVEYLIKVGRAIAERAIRES